MSRNSNHVVSLSADQLGMLRTLVQLRLEFCVENDNEPEYVKEAEQLSTLRDALKPEGSPSLSQQLKVQGRAVARRSLATVEQAHVFHNTVQRLPSTLTQEALFNLWRAGWESGVRSTLPSTDE